MLQSLTQLKSYVDSPQRLFVEQQLKWLTHPSATARRWHPKIVRWALLPHNTSKSAYKYMQDSELVCLPSERTLSDYRGYKPPISGVDKQYILNIASEFGKQDVPILIDEIKSQQGLLTVHPQVSYVDMKTHCLM